MVSTISLNYIFKFCLLVYIILGASFPLNERTYNILNKYRELITYIFLMLSFCMYMLDYVLCILIIGSAIVLFCSLSHEFKVKINNLEKEYYKTEKEISKPILLEEKPKKENICQYVLDKDPITEHINNHIKPGLEYIQSNIFDPINYDLYYKDVLMQFNIQGLEEDITGYDKTIY